jgi:hypothetical protein
VARWHYKGLDTFVNERIRVEVSLDPGMPIEKYVFRNPAVTRNKYEWLFNYRWLVIQGIGPHRQQGEAARWHFIDRFLGEGIVLSYIGIEEFNFQQVEVIHVDDRRYGHYFEAFFNRHTGLLLATREGLTPAEQERYRRTNGRRPPVTNTVYQDYRPVQGVLTSHRLKRSQKRPVPPPCS